jgi:hypothetical protein
MFTKIVKKSDLILQNLGDNFKRNCYALANFLCHIYHLKKRLKEKNMFSIDRKNYNDVLLFIMLLLIFLITGFDRFRRLLNIDVIIVKRL